MFSAVIALGTYYNGGDNYINRSILSRLQDGELAIDNTNGRISTQNWNSFTLCLKILVFCGLATIRLQFLL